MRLVDGEFHSQRFCTRACLAIGENAHVVAVEYARDKGLYLAEHLCVHAVCHVFQCRVCMCMDTHKHIARLCACVRTCFGEHLFLCRPRTKALDIRQR